MCGDYVDMSTSQEITKIKDLVENIEEVVNLLGEDRIELTSIVARMEYELLGIPGRLEGDTIKIPTCTQVPPSLYERINNILHYLRSERNWIRDNVLILRDLKDAVVKISDDAKVPSK